jgi:hypothetical protein
VVGAVVGLQARMHVTRGRCQARRGWRELTVVLCHRRGGGGLRGGGVRLRRRRSSARQRAPTCPTNGGGDGGEGRLVHRRRFAQEGGTH